MIKMEEIFMIRDMKNQGLYIKDIAQIMGKSSKTISTWLNQNKAPEYKRTKEKESKLEPYKSYIMQRMNEGCFNAVVIYEEIQSQGYTGKMTILRDFIKPLRKNRIAKASSRFETAPGKQAQVDWGEFKFEYEGKEKKIHAFVMVLGYSRKIYVEFTEDEKISTLIGCHERAFEYFAGVCENILYDNMKTVVSHSNKAGEAKWNKTFLAFANHHGFTPVRCRPYSPRTKGKVENGVKYVRNNFWPRVREFSGISNLNERAISWADQTANKRVHGTLHEVPDKRFELEKLKLFNEISFESSYAEERKVSNDSFVSYKTVRYSVPYKYVGSYVSVKDLKNGKVEIYSSDNNLIARHEKSFEKYGLVKDKKHFEGIMSGNHEKVAPTAPKLIPKQIPKVHERPLSIYDELLDEAEMSKC